MSDFEVRVQRAAEQHLAACQEAFWAMEERGEIDAASPAFGPFCGCDTCVVREVLSVCWDEMLAEAKRADA